MAEQEGRRALFSCVGTSDPARGDHDGGLMHIMRYYHPEVVCIFMTPSIIEADKKDDRINKMMRHMRDQWNGYQPQLIRVDSDVRDPSDLDELQDHIDTAITRLTQANDYKEILVNLSSGTPQMQMLLMQAVLDPRYKMRGIQVKTPENDASKAERTNDAEYSVDEQLEMAEEFETDEQQRRNRCVEPELFPVRRNAQWQQIDALLKQKDYFAISNMKRSLPDTEMQLVRHLAARYQLRHEEAKKASKLLKGKLEFELYPHKGAHVSRDYEEVSEYFLMMKNFQITQRYTDFVLRLNPFTVRLQQALLNKLLKEHCDDRLTVSALMKVNPFAHRRQLSRRLFEQKVPKLLEKLDEELQKRDKKAFCDSDPSIYIYNILLSAFEDIAGEADKLPEKLAVFQHCEKLNCERNNAAHNLLSLTDEQIREKIGMPCTSLVSAIEGIFPGIYPECDPKLFGIYKICEEYIRKNH